MAAASERERRLELIGIIEQALREYEESIRNGEERPSLRRKIPQPRRQIIIEPDPFEEGENDDWESEEDEDADKENQPPPEEGPDLLGGRISDFTRECRLRALSQIHELLVENRHATKRDLFYEAKQLYKFQYNFDRALSAICIFLGASRQELHVVSCSKGFAIGDLHLCYAMDEIEVDFRHSPVPITEALTKFDLVQTDAKFLLIVEKDSVFQRLLDEHWTEKFPQSILVTGRGYPDICTRKFLAWLAAQLPKLPMLVLVDADPYGIEIYLTYKFGSERSRIESGAVQLLRLQWIGFLPSVKIDNLNKNENIFPNPLQSTSSKTGLIESEILSIPVDQFLQLSSSDKRKIQKLAERVLAHGEQLVFEELSVLRRNRWKLEIEAIAILGNEFLTDVYLNYKLQPYIR